MIQRDGIYDLMGLSEQPIKQASSAPFFLLFGGCVSQSEAAELVSDHAARHNFGLNTLSRPHRQMIHFLALNIIGVATCG